MPKRRGNKIDAEQLCRAPRVVNATYTVLAYLRYSAKAMKRLFPRSAAYHEAGHAVARIYVGARATDTRVFENGSGYSDGTLESWNSTNAGFGTLWDFLLVCMAGAHAEARVTKRSLKKLRFSHGLKDYAMASCLVVMLARRGRRREKAIWRQADRERRHFLRYCWPTIDAMASPRSSGLISDSGKKKAAVIPIPPSWLNPGL